MHDLKRHGKTLNILRTKRAFKMKWAFFIICKGLSVTRNCLSPDSGPLRIGVFYLVDAKHHCS